MRFILLFVLACLLVGPFAVNSIDIVVGFGSVTLSSVDFVTSLRPLGTFPKVNILKVKTGVNLTFTNSAAESLTFTVPLGGKVKKVSLVSANLKCRTGAQPDAVIALKIQKQNSRKVTNVKVNAALSASYHSCPTLVHTTPLPTGSPTQKTPAPTLPITTPPPTPKLTPQPTVAPTPAPIGCSCPAKTIRAAVGRITTYGFTDAKMCLFWYSSGVLLVPCDSPPAGASVGRMEWNFCWMAGKYLILNTVSCGAISMDNFPPGVGQRPQIRAPREPNYSYQMWVVDSLRDIRICQDSATCNGGLYMVMNDNEGNVIMNNKKDTVGWTFPSGVT